MKSGHNQMIEKPTHYINESSPCIDLIFSSNVNLAKNCGVKLSLYKKCHLNIMYGIVNLNILLPPLYFSPYFKDFKIKNCNEQCKVLLETLLNIFRKFILYKIKRFDYKTPE